MLKIKPTMALFQSTPPARGATIIFRTGIGIHKFQSTPPARGATIWLLRRVSRLFDISIHAPREGGDDSM